MTDAERRTRIEALMKQMAEADDPEEIVDRAAEGMARDLMDGLKEAVDKAMADADVRNKRDRRDRYIQAAITGMIAGWSPAAEGSDIDVGYLVSRATMIADVAIAKADATQP